jgi:hydroxymethylbilane synthase
MASAPPGSAAERTSFTVGTRKSRLALIQTDILLGALQKAWPQFSFKVETKDTAGDRNKTTALRDFTSKNLWTQELEELLVDGNLDLIAHSLKGPDRLAPIKFVVLAF